MISLLGCFLVVAPHAWNVEFAHVAGETAAESPLGVPPETIADDQVPASEVSSLLTSDLEALRAGIPRIGRRSLALWLPLQIDRGDIGAWASLLEFDSAAEERLLKSWQEWRSEDDALRRREFLPLFDLAAEVCSPSATWTAAEVRRISQELESSIARVMMKIRSGERRMFAKAFERPVQAGLVPAEAASDEATRPTELDAASQALVDALCQLRAIDLHGTVVDTLPAVRVDLPILIARFARRELDEANARVVRTIVRDGLRPLEVRSVAYRAKIDARLHAGARFNAAANLQAAGASLPAEIFDDWRRARARARREAAAAAKSLLDANLALLESACAALPEAKARALRSAYFSAAFGPFREGPWDPAPCLAEAAKLARGDACESIARLASASSIAQSELHGRVRLRFVEYRVAALGLAGLSEREWLTALERLRAVHAEGRRSAEATLAEVRSLVPEALREQWDAACDAWRNRAEAMAKAQLASLDPDLEKRADTIRQLAPAGAAARP